MRALFIGPSVAGSGPIRVVTGLIIMGDAPVVWAHQVGGLPGGLSGPISVVLGLINGRRVRSMGPSGGLAMRASLIGPSVPGKWAHQAEASLTGGPRPAVQVRRHSIGGPVSLINPTTSPDQR